MKCSILKDRILWFDGTSTIVPENIYDYLPYLSHITVTEYSEDIIEYNRSVVRDEQIQLVDPLTKDSDKWGNEWTHGQELSDVEVLDHINHHHVLLCKKYKWSENEFQLRNTRIKYEYDKMVSNNLMPLIKTLICVINTMIEKNVVWGTGRGSSTSSYLLFVMQLHDVDSYRYDIDFSDFIKQ